MLPIRQREDYSGLSWSCQRTGQHRESKILRRNVQYPNQTSHQPTRLRGFQTSKRLVQPLRGEWSPIAQLLGCGIDSRTLTSTAYSPKQHHEAQLLSDLLARVGLRALPRNLRHQSKPQHPLGRSLAHRAWLEVELGEQAVLAVLVRGSSTMSMVL